ncbi:MAG: lipid-A-disaccharide synthase [Nitrospiraceae bacterium]|nr:lipid-A-disaccharide synthase [Nitrospiraceae bacterium]
MSKRLLIVAGESSGELYGALLAAELRRMAPDVRIMGVGGERMEAEGVEIIRRVSGAFGLTELVSHIRELRATFREILQRIDQDRPQAAILIDFPDFNFRAAAELKRRGVPVLYYVSPQLWAWRAGRIKKMKALADRVALILPFEEEIYRKAAVPHEFVGHPVLDEISGMTPPKKADMGLDGARPLLSLLPGSRPSELKRHLPLFFDVMSLFRREFPEWQFFMPVAPNLKTGPFSEQFRAFRESGVVIRKENAVGALAASDAALIASGTATLQAAFLERPFTVVYRLSPLTFHIAKALVKVKYVSLVNILSGGQAVKEFLQDKANSGDVMAELRRIVKDAGYRRQMVSVFRDVRAMFGGRSASARVAEMVCEMAGWR